MRHSLIYSLFALLSAAIPQCSGNVVYSTLGQPGDTFSSNLAWVLINNNGPFSGATQLASSFTPTTDYTLDTIRAAVRYFGDTADQVYSFQIAADNAGVPGTLLESFTAPGVTTGASAFNQILEFSSTLHPELMSGSTYWVIMSDFTNSTSSLRTGGWRLNDQGLTGLAYLTSSWTSTSLTAPAFEVLGTTPEPSGVLTLPAALSALLWLRRRNRSRR